MKCDISAADCFFSSKLVSGLQIYDLILEMDYKEGLPALSVKRGTH